MHDEIQLVTDGAARGNPGPAAIGFAILDLEGGTLVQDVLAIGRATNNEAEYLALIAGLEAARKFTKKRVHHVSDSEVVVGQVSGAMRVNARNLAPHHERVMELKREFSRVTHEAVRRTDPRIVEVDARLNDELDRRAARDHVRR